MTQFILDFKKSDEIPISKERRKYRFIKFCLHLTCTILFINLMLLGSYFLSFWGGI